jgi:hypothetical protein
MISIDAPFRVSEECRAFGVCLLMCTSRAHEFGLAVESAFSATRTSSNCRPLTGNESCSSKGLLRPDHWMILIVRLDRALIAMPRRHARQVQQTVQQSRIPRHINRCIFNNLWTRRGGGSPPYVAPLAARRGPRDGRQSLLRAQQLCACQLCTAIGTAQPSVRAGAAARLGASVPL